MRRNVLLAAAVVALTALAGGIAVTSAATGSTAGPSRATAPPGLAGFPPISCKNGKVVGDSPIKHVIYLQFDNLHLHRNLPTVPSDLEQMPHLLNFIRSNGTLLTNDHTVLISHTANGILTALTGVYPDRQGQAVANSFRYFNPDGTSNRSGVSFAVLDRRHLRSDDPDAHRSSFNMVTADGQMRRRRGFRSRARAVTGVGPRPRTWCWRTRRPDVTKVFGPDRTRPLRWRLTPGPGARRLRRDRDPLRPGSNFCARTRTAAGRTCCPRSRAATGLQGSSATST